MRNCLNENSEAVNNVFQWEIIAFSELLKMELGILLGIPSWGYLFVRIFYILESWGYFLYA
nr:MAG TPA: hypothetical protein [Caudoviricetes sp.]DAS82097.1 MAG TPA: hypothetical protein [Caudoviricetes sp.]